MALQKTLIFHHSDLNPFELNFGWLWLLRQNTAKIYIWGGGGGGGGLSVELYSDFDRDYRRLFGIRNAI